MIIFSSENTSASPRCTRSSTTPSPPAASTTSKAARSRWAGSPPRSTSSTSTRAPPGVRRGQAHLPARDHTGPRAGELYWKPLRLDQVLDILHNPRYAGAYCYGRRAHRSGGGKTSTTVKPRDQWTTLIPGAHDGYITWAQFEANQQQLAANAAARGGDRKAGPPREGPALQSLVI